MRRLRRNSSPSRCSLLTVIWAATHFAAQPGGENYIWPQGRNVTGYQFQDDISWTKGKHTMTFGWTMRRDDLTDFSPSEFTASPEAYTTNASFQQGYVDLWYEQFPTRLTQPVALYNMGWYAQDQWKPMPNLTITYGLRMEHNSDPICRTRLLRASQFGFQRGEPQQRRSIQHAHLLGTRNSAGEDAADWMGAAYRVRIPALRPFEQNHASCRLRYVC